MKKAKSTDILFYSDIQLTSSSANSPFVKYLDILIALLGVLGITYIFIMSFNIEVDYITINSSIFCSVLFFSFIFKKIELLKYSLIGTALVYAVGVYIFYKHIFIGFMAIWNIAMQAINHNSNIKLNDYSNISLSISSYSIGIFFIFLIFLISSLICFSIIYNPNFILLLIITVPILGIGLYFDILPSYLYIMMLVVSLVSVLGMRTIKNTGRINKSKFIFKKKSGKHVYIVSGENRGITTKVGTIVGLISAITIVMTLIIYPPSTYKCPAMIVELNAKLQAFNFEEFKDDLMGVAKGGVNGGKLGTVNKIKYKNETDLEVTTPWLGKNIYLRGYTGCKYTGNSWDEMDEDTYSKFIQEDDYINGFTINTEMSGILCYSKSNFDENYVTDISIKNINANKKYIYMPYSSTSGNYRYNDIQIQNDRDSYLYVPNNEDEYGTRYFPNVVTLKDADKVKNEVIYQMDNFTKKFDPEETGYSILDEDKNYNELVQDVYTKLPDKGLEEIINKYSGRYNENKDLNACVKETIAAITDGTTFDLAPGKLPKGKDFVEYFLYENKKGYCTHYASAAAVILRAMGVPTRYVEGYVINKNDAENAKSIAPTYIEYLKTTPLNEVEAIDKFKITKESFKQQSVNSVMYKTDKEFKLAKMQNMDIKDTNAHAWIEVYLEKVGWIPIDVTPSTSENSECVSTEFTSIKESTPNNSEQPNQPVTNTNTVQEIIISNPLATETQQSIIMKILNSITIFIAILLIILAIIIIRHKSIIYRRKKSFSCLDNSKAVHNIYKSLVNIFYYLKINNKDNLQIIEYVKLVEAKYPFINEYEFSEIIRILFKADFSKNEILLEELNKIEGFAIKFNNEVYKSLSKLQKFEYTYLKNLR